MIYLILIYKRNATKIPTFDFDCLKRRSRAYNTNSDKNDNILKLILYVKHVLEALFSNTSKLIYGTII